MRCIRLSWISGRGLVIDMKTEGFDRHGLKIGDYVARMAIGAHGDNFKCHEFTFGRIRAFQAETTATRPDAAPKFGLDEWEEVLVMPFDEEMAPEKERPWIQWGAEECIKISRLEYFLRAIIWPLTKMIYSEPLAGRNTDRV